jgi:hypothetical protein
LRNLLLIKELLVVLCFVFWFWFSSFCFLSLFVLGSFGYRHNTIAHTHCLPPLLTGLEKAQQQHY